MRTAYKQKNPTISNVKSLDLWSEWRESNSRPLEPHSSALPKLRYTRISVSVLPLTAHLVYPTKAVLSSTFSIFFLRIFMDLRGGLRAGVELHGGQGHGKDALGTGSQQSLCTRGGCCAGGDDIVHKEDALALHPL